MVIYGNMTGGSSTIGKTVEIISDDGIDLMGVVVDQETILTAIASKDIREGKTAITDEGFVVGSKKIPNYHTTTGVRLIQPQSEFNIPLLDDYDYTELQAMMAPFNSDMDHSVAVNMVVIKDKVYMAGSTDVVSNITKDTENKSILLGITNGDNQSILRYFTYREES